MGLAVARLTGRHGLLHKDDKHRGRAPPKHKPYFAPPARRERRGRPLLHPPRSADDSLLAAPTGENSLQEDRKVCGSPPPSPSSTAPSAYSMPPPVPWTASTRKMRTTSPATSSSLAVTTPRTSSMDCIT